VSVNGMQIQVTYPALECTVCRRSCFSWPWSAEDLWNVDALPLLLKHARPGRGYDHTYEVAGALNEEDLPAIARENGWVIHGTDAICVRCQASITRLHSVVLEDHRARLTRTDSKVSPDSTKEGEA
jgi:hypothetical protein